MLIPLFAMPETIWDSINERRCPASLPSQPPPQICFSGAMPGANQPLAASFDEILCGNDTLNLEWHRSPSNVCDSDADLIKTAQQEYGSRLDYQATCLDRPKGSWLQPTIFGSQNWHIQREEHLAL